MKTNIFDISYIWLLSQTAHDIVQKRFSGYYSQQTGFLNTHCWPILLLFENFVIDRYIGIRLQDKEGDGTNPGFGRGFEYAMWSSLTDESIYNNDDNTWLVQRGLLAPENTGIAGTIWGRSYRSIRECNFAIGNIDNVA